MGDLKQHLIDNFKVFIEDKKTYLMGTEYLQYCIKQLHDDDRVLAEKYVVPLFK